MTLRITLGIVSFVVLALFWAGVYRPTRSAFAGWWTVSLLWSTASPVLFLLDGTRWQAIANPLASGMAVCAAFSMWFATRSLRGRSSSIRVMALAAVVVTALAFLDSPATNTWAGNGLLFAVMSTCFGLGAWDMWVVWRDRRFRPDRRNDQEALVASFVSGVAASLLSAFYAVRAVLFVAWGPESPLFNAVAGSGTTTIVLQVCLVAVTFTVSALGYDQRTQELRRQVAHDDLTHVLGRSAWMDGARALVDNRVRSGDSVAIVVADIDHFKAINDSRGHAVGDAVLLAFGTAMADVLRRGEIAGRLGGEEFALALIGVDAEGARRRMDELNDRLTWLLRTDRLPATTVSYGVSHVRERDTVESVVERADAAMYRAKQAGRDTVVVDGADERPSASA